MNIIEAYDAVIEHLSAEVDEPALNDAGLPVISPEDARKAVALLALRLGMLLGNYPAGSRPCPCGRGLLFYLRLFRLYSFFHRDADTTRQVLRMSALWCRLLR